MANGLMAPVIAGLAVGVAFLLTIFLFFQGSSPSRIISSFHGTTIYIPQGAAIEERNFEPRTPTVVIGLNNTVRWINQEEFAVELNIEGKWEPIIEYDSMTTESSSLQVILVPDEPFVCEFYTPGSYPIHIAPWPWMRGTITVLPAWVT